MRKLAAAIAVAVATGTAVANAAPAPGGKASLHLVGLHPVVLQGQHFAPRERLRLQFLGPQSSARRLVAGLAGTFAVTFADMLVTRCDTFRVLAIRTAGGLVELKHLPAPACQAQ